MDVNIAELIPIGRNNAIRRNDLIEKCVVFGLIDQNVSDKDREMRRLLQKARLDCTILNLSDGNGYYRVSREDLQDLLRYSKQEGNRAKASFRNHILAKKLYEDYQSGRIQE